MLLHDYNDPSYYAGVITFVMTELCKKFKTWLMLSNLQLIVPTVLLES